MPDSTAPTRRAVTGSLRVLVIIVLSTMMASLAAGTANAHAQLTSTTPSDGATLTTPPSVVTFTFDAELLPGTNTISINDDHGNVVATQAVQPEGATASVAWPATLEHGTYQVAYRVVSADGHPVTGAITFTITGPGSPSSTSLPSNTPPPAASQIAPTPNPPPSPRTSTILLLVLAVAVSTGILVAILVIRRRHS